MLRRPREVLQQAGSVSPMPKLTTHVVRNHFERPVEQAVYAKHFSKYRNLIKHYEASGTLTENYTQIFTELLRLRQACNHPDLGMLQLWQAMYTIRKAEYVDSAPIRYRDA